MPSPSLCAFFLALCCCLPAMASLLFRLLGWLIDHNTQCDGQSSRGLTGKQSKSNCHAEEDVAQRFTDGAARDLSRTFQCWVSEVACKALQEPSNLLGLDRHSRKPEVTQTPELV